ncbi:MAG TPA: polynucleotide adenylyltransferase PcnB [Gammaproteobacteria bacterium]|nr:polynucleotide adenylyltransferase PcnB [Gammaproteobacteria bacterium]
MRRLAKEKPSFKKNIPILIPRAEHQISRSAINRNALKVLYRLHEAGFSAYLVGGCVRDLLLGVKPKDFDIATDARPEEVRKLFKNCRLIGKRFRLAHILFGSEIIEVATFRTHHENAKEQHGKTHQGMIIRDNVYGTIEDDAWRRDFRINALYYNIADYSVVDYTGGIQDIKDKVLHMIGDPMQRFHEDPVRLLRAIRFLAKLNISITAETEEPLNRLSYLLGHVAPGRLFQEVLKFFQEGASLATVLLLQKYNLFSQLFPETGKHLENTVTMQLLKSALANTDTRIKEDKNISPAFLFAVFLWHPVQKDLETSQQSGLPIYVAYEKALQYHIKKQTEVLAIPRVMQITIRDICLLQYRLLQRRGSQPFRLLHHPRFRAGYDLLMIRAEHEDPAKELAAWWTRFIDSSHEDREKLLKEVEKPAKFKRRRKRK